MNCFGCGITRAVISGVQFNFTNAVAYNKWVVIVLPLLIYKWFKDITMLYLNSRNPNTLRNN